MQEGETQGVGYLAAAGQADVAGDNQSTLPGRIPERVQGGKIAIVQQRPAHVFAVAAGLAEDLGQDEGTVHESQDRQTRRRVPDPAAQGSQLFHGALDAEESALQGLGIDGGGRVDDEELVGAGRQGRLLEELSSWFVIVNQLASANIHQKAADRQVPVDVYVGPVRRDGTVVERRVRRGAPRARSLQRLGGPEEGAPLAGAAVERVRIRAPQGIHRGCESAAAGLPRPLEALPQGVQLGHGLRQVQAHSRRTSTRWSPTRRVMCSWSRSRAMVSSIWCPARSPFGFPQD